MYSRFEETPPLLSEQEGQARPSGQSERIDDYLDHVSAGLLALPYPQRAEIRRELRQHIAALAAAHEEMGSTPKAAVEAALSRFGDPARIARGFVQAWHVSSPRERMATPWLAIRHGLRWFSGAMALLALEVIGLMHAFSGPSEGLFLVSLWILPIIAGWKTGAAAPIRAGLGTFYALAALAFASLPISLPALLYLGSGANQLTALLTPVFAFWMPLGCLSASLSGTLSGKRAARFRRV